MSILRRVKLRTPDGTESIEYPLGVNAENVEVTNRENLSQRLARIDEDLEENEEDIAAVNEIAGTNRQNIGAAEIRIDTLERRSASVEKKPYYFDTVANMKVYQGLKEGDMTITLGYYTANDGGGAEYIIKTSSNTHYEELNNGLIAELIYHENINIKTVGAYGDGIHDDTLIIQNLINTIRTNVIAHNIEEIKTIIFPGGKYKISSTIIVSPYVKIKTSGFTTLLSYVANGPCLYLAHSSGDQISSPTGNRQDWYRGDWINGESGLLIKNMSNNTTTSIGIEIGSRTNIGELLPTARYMISNMRIQGFYIGILHNIYNNYLGTFFRVSLENNYNCIQYGTSTNIHVVNSGEKMTYIDCLFATAETGIYWYCDSMDSYFTNCSFDFLQHVFHIGEDYTNIEVNGCHIEGTIDSLITGALNKQFSQISITNSEFIHTQAPFSTESTSITIILENNKLLYHTAPVNNYGATFLFDKAIKVKAINNIRAHNLRGNMISKAINLITNDDFSDLATGTIVISDRKLGKRILEYNEFLITNFEICEDNSFDGKYLKIQSPGGNFNFFINSDIIPVISNKMLVINDTWMNARDFTKNILFYDSNKELISQQNIYHYIPDETKALTNVWTASRFLARAYIPAGVSYIRIKYGYNFRGDQEYGCVGRIIAEYE